MQLIEGAREEVADVFSPIVSDDRHSGVARLLAERRVFPDCSMNYFRVDPAEGKGWMLVRHDDPVDSLMPPIRRAS